MYLFLQACFFSYRRLARHDSRRKEYSKLLQNIATPVLCQYQLSPRSLFSPQSKHDSFLTSINKKCPSQIVIPSHTEPNKTSILRLKCIRQDPNQSVVHAGPSREMLIGYCFNYSRIMSRDHVWWWRCNFILIDSCSCIHRAVM